MSVKHLVQVCERRQNCIYDTYLRRQHQRLYLFFVFGSIGVYASNTNDMDFCDRLKMRMYHFNVVKLTAAEKHSFVTLEHISKISRNSISYLACISSSLDLSSSLLFMVLVGFHQLELSLVVRKFCLPNGKGMIVFCPELD